MEECWLTDFMAWIAYEFPYPGFVMSNYPQRRSDLTQMHMRKKDKKESLKVSQCANPECLRELRYLRDGDLCLCRVRGERQQIAGTLLALR